MDKFLKFLSNKYILSILFINIFFFLLTFNNPWTLDDYGYFSAGKLYNLINNKVISFEPFIFGSGYGLHLESRYMPLFYFLNQILPSSSILFHLIIVTVHTLTCFIVFLISEKIFQKKNLYFLFSLFYTLNYSISIKALSWNVFYGHIIAAFFGLLSIYFLILLFEEKRIKKIYLLIYFLLSSFSFLTTESGLVFPIIGSFILLFFFKKDKLISKFFISLFPLVIFIFLVYLNTGKILPLLKDRATNEDQTKVEKILNSNNENKIHFYRSTYAPRNLEGYVLRSIDNVLGSINLTSLEKVLKYYDKNDIIKFHFKKNIYFFLTAILFIILFFLFFILKEKYSKKNLNLITKSFVIYLLIFFIYSIIFFRRDINFGLSFCSALLLTSLIKNLNDNNSIFKIRLIVISFVLPSVLYATTFFSYWGEDWGPKSEMIKKSNYIIQMTKKGELIQNLKYRTDYKNLYYLYHFNNYQSYLSKKYKNMNFINFQKTLEKDFELFQNK